MGVDRGPSGSRLSAERSFSGPEKVSISDLLPAVDSPRIDGEDPEHVRMLAGSEEALPPVLVQRDSLRIVDGSHRLKAAALRGDETIEVVYFEGSEEEAFVAATQANVTHGLPLSLADRKAAAARILSFYPEWSDRAIAKITGLAAKTVVALRRPTDVAQQLDRRVGMDGRVRPVDRVSGRMRAAEIVRDKPGASLREIAQAAGVSPMTARDVRERIERGDSPIPDRRSNLRTALPAPERVARSKAEPVEPGIVLQKLRQDPSLRQTEAGRSLIRWLDAQVRSLANWPTSPEEVPPHCLYALVEIGYAFGDRWRTLAEEAAARLDNRG